jgi:isopenicillin-N epimerase
VDRRGFLVRSGLSLAASALATWSDTPGLQAQIVDWDAVRSMFSVSPDYLHFGGLYLASHPRPVQQAIEAHRRGLDDNPVDYLHEQGPMLEAGVLRAAANYLGGSVTDIALTDSTTMGLGLLYAGLSVGPGQEILTSVHDFYATHEALQLSARRSGASLRRIELYQRSESATEDEIVESVAQALTERTRILALTWVHSSTGLKLPIQRIADVVPAVISLFPAVINGYLAHAAQGWSGDAETRHGQRLDRPFRHLAMGRRRARSTPPADSTRSSIAGRCPKHSTCTNSLVERA